MIFNTNQQRAIDSVMSGQNTFITGFAGTGKTTILNHILENHPKKRKIAITATTGIAAVNIGGKTIHSFFGIGLGRESASTLVNNMYPAVRKKIMATKVLVIDEISMLTPELLDKLEYIARTIKGNHQFFGGIQLVFIGDFGQLPPVQKNIEETKFAFESHTWNTAMFNSIELNEVYRQESKLFIDILTELRTGKLSKQSEFLLTSTCDIAHKVYPEGIVPTHLYATNQEVRARNAFMLEAIDEPEHTFIAIKNGVNPHAIENLVKNSRIEECLVLKKGANVMMMINKWQNQGIANGSQGIVKDFIGDDTVVVQFGKDTINVSVHSFEDKEYNPDTEQHSTKASVVQIPLLLSYALTHHKAQGSTIEYMHADLTKTFCDNQVYVALSRAKSLEGLSIEGLDRDKIKTSEKVIEFYNNLNGTKT